MPWPPKGRDLAQCHGACRLDGARGARRVAQTVGRGQCTRVTQANPNSSRRGAHFPCGGSWRYAARGACCAIAGRLGECVWVPKQRQQEGLLQACAAVRARRQRRPEGVREGMANARGVAAPNHGGLEPARSPRCAGRCSQSPREWPGASCVTLSHKLAHGPSHELSQTLI